MKMLEAVQPYIDTSISKTVNVPEDYPYEEFKNLYMNGWKAGLKGLATYRPNSILGSVLSVSETPVVDSGAIGGAPVPESVGNPLLINFKSRPAGDLAAVTRKMVYYTSEGEKKIYLSISFMKVDGYVDGKPITIERPIEFFVPANQRDDSQQWVAANMRMLSQIARSGASVADSLSELREVVWDRGLVRYSVIDRPDGTTGTRMHESEVAAIAYALQEMLRERGFLDTNYRVKPLAELSKGAGTVVIDVLGDAVVHVTGSITVAGVVQGTRCSECGEHAVIKVDGCKKCTACGAIGACG